MTADRDRGAPPDPRSPAQRDIDEELAFHHAETVAELLAAGVSPAAAEIEARRRFGLTSHRDNLVRMELRRQAGARRRATMSACAMAVRSLVRTIRHAPGFTLGVVTVLALGLGVNAITFGFVDRLVLSGPAGIERPGELRRVIVHGTSRQGAAIAGTEIGYLDYRDFVGAAQLAGAAGESATPLLLGAGESAERIQARLVTASFFPLLGVHPAVGRFFTADESERAGARVAVLSYAFWQRRFGGDASVVGRVLPIESHRYEVVGVAPRSFTGAAVTRVDVFLPLEAASDEQIEGPWRTSRNFRWMGAIVRLAPGARDEAVEAALTAGYRSGHAGQKGADPTARIELVPLDAVTGAAADGATSVAALVGAVALLVLLIAFANVANLFLARALRHRDGVAVRLAIGGGRARLIAEEAMGGALLAAVGAGVALLVAVAGARSAQLFLFPEVHWLDTTVSLRLLVFVAGCAIAGGGIAAALPMWQAGRADVSGWLRSGGGQRVSRTRTQGVFLLAQGALSVLLLVGAGLFVRSLHVAQTFDAGLDTGRLLVVSAMPGDAPPRADFRAALREGVTRIPGVERTTLAAGTVPFVSSWAIRLRVPGLDDLPVTDEGGAYVAAVEAGYFETVGTAVVEGRAFTTDDREGAERVTIVNRTMARLYWPGRSALGQCLQIGPEGSPCWRVVGVVENTRRQALVEGDSLLYYVPIAQAPEDLRAGRLIVRMAEDDDDAAARVGEAIRRQALALEPNLRYASARPLDAIISPQLRAWRLGAGLFTAFGVLALAVAAVGLYSVVAFDIEGRRRELGVRAALGATSGTILRLVIGDGLKLAAGGVAVGLGLAWLLAPALSSLLYEVRPRDPRVFGVVTVVLVLATVAASLAPALRAAHADPSRVLRDE